MGRLEDGVMLLALRYQGLDVGKKISESDSTFLFISVQYVGLFEHVEFGNWRRSHRANNNTGLKLSADQGSLS